MRDVKYTVGAIVTVLLSLFVGVLVAGLASGAEVVLMRRDQSGNSPARYRSGDILHVWTDADVAAMWAQIDARGEADQWTGADRSLAPLSDTMLQTFLVVAVDDALAQTVKQLWTEQETTGSGESEVLVRKRKRFVNWQTRVPAQYHDAINSGERIDLRGVVKIPSNWVETH